MAELEALAEVRSTGSLRVIQFRSACDDGQATGMVAPIFNL